MDTFVLQTEIISMNLSTANFLDQQLAPKFPTSSRNLIFQQSAAVSASLLLEMSEQFPNGKFFVKFTFKGQTGKRGA